MFRFALFAFVATVAAKVTFNEQCPDIKIVENFDLKAYGTGVWYEIARYPNVKETNGKCGYAEYLLEGDIVKVKNIDLDSNNKLRFIEGTHRLAPDAGNSGKILVRLPYGGSGKVLDIYLNVLAIEYDNFVVGYYCKYNEATKSRRDFSWVLSRSKVPSTETRAKIDKVIQDSKFLNADNYIWPSFTDEDCKVKED